MSLAADKKREIIEAYWRSPGDTGSPEVQIALLSARIEHLAGHFQQHPKDHHSRRGMLKLVAKRRRLLEYLRSRNFERYKALIERLGIRR